MQYELDLADPKHLTANYIHHDGTRHDMNAKGEPCETVEELEQWIRDLGAQQIISDEDCKELLQDLLIATIEEDE